jgi:CheY-like chemotaxis protein
VETGTAGSGFAWSAPRATMYHGKSVLYVEDNPVNLTLMQLVLGTLDGLTVLHAPDAEAGVAAAARHRPNLILSDLHMPGINGIEGVRRLKANAETCDIPVVMVSSDNTDDNVAAAMDAGCVAFLPKPFEISKMITVVVAVLSEPDPTPQP